jgi:hypothetical protein
MEDAENVVFFREAWKLADKLMSLDDHKMWKVIQGVWVEMLCFSASRYRGYLHAKALGTGGELLSYVWLLMSHMGMETLPERMQREVPVPVEVGNTSDTHTSGAAPEDLSSSAPSTSKVLDPSNSEVLSGDIASASEIHPAYKDDKV